MAMKTCAVCHKLYAEQFASCPHCGGKTGGILIKTALAIVGIVVMMGVVGAITGAKDKAGAPQPVRQAIASPAPQISTTNPAATAAAPAAKPAAKEEPFEDDLTKRADFLKSNPHYIEAIGQLIHERGFECPAVTHLYIEGTSPYGTRLEALCGPPGTGDVYRSLHYAVYPDRLMVNVCKPFGEGSDCE